MAPERIVLCGGVAGRGAAGTRPLELCAYGPAANVNFKLEQLRRALWATVPPLLRDLLDVAVYVYAADQAVPRGDGGRLDGTEIGAGWRRNLRLCIPVREPATWNAAPVRAALESVLGFLSEDEYTFEFPHLRHDYPLEGRLDFSATPFHGVVREVVLFSGGLDSLAGAVLESVVERRTVLLLNHRSTEKLTPHHQALARALEQHAAPYAPLHVPVWVNKAKHLGRETTQRTRSFLYACLGAVFARMIDLSRVRFYENGVTSLNLPPVGQVVGARASRTTHPRTLAGFAEFFSALFGKPFKVENRFQWDTKTDVVKRIADAGCGALIGASRSCARTWQAKTKTHLHCGVCSQCVDRRFAALAAGCADRDPAAGYAVDLLTGERRPGESAMMLSAYLSLTERLERMGETQFVAQFGELARALPHLGMPASAGASRAFALYSRHARQVSGVITAAIGEHADRIRRRDLPPSCLLRLVYDDGAAAAPVDAVRPNEPDRPAGNYFLRRGGCWVGRFGDGAEKIYLPDIGFEYLHILIGQPDRDFTAAELDSRLRQRRAARPADVARAAVAAGEVRTSAAGADEVLDADAVQAYRVRLAELEDAIPLAQANVDEVGFEAFEALVAERQAIEAELRRGHQRAGRRRTFGTDDRERVRKRVCNAIVRARKQIADHDEHLSEHLQKPGLTLGHRLRYTPRGGVAWVTEA